MEGVQSDSIVLEEEIDPNYEPTEKEVLEYATWLGMDLEAERDLFWIAREGLKAPLPENWKPCKTTDTEEIYYFNFASGQSTWDHPCDEFYRNLYEENKKKHQSKETQHKETDEKKKIEKDDVAELLGRKGGGKKKKTPLTKAERLGPAPLGRVNSLEKKPLPGLSGRLEALGPSASSGGALKPVGGGLGGLGPLRGEAKYLGTPDLSNDHLGGELKHDELTKPLSRPPLGGLLSRKPLLPSSPSALPKVESKAELEELTSAFEQKKENMIQEHAEKMREVEITHETELNDLRKKMKAQLEEFRDTEDDKLKRLKREFDKKKNDLENQFDREENIVQRSRKEQLKRLEAEAENALAHKKQELDRELRLETEKAQSKHAATLCELRDEFQRDEKQLADKLKVSLAEQNEAVNAATTLKAEVERLLKAQKHFEIELADIRSEKEIAAQEKSTADDKCADLILEVKRLQSLLQEVPTLDATAPHPHECSKCTDLEGQLSIVQAEANKACKSVETERAQMQKDMNELRGELELLKKGAEVQAIQASKGGNESPAEPNCGLVDEVNILKGQEALLKVEITGLKQQLATALLESDELRKKCATLQSERKPASDAIEPSALAPLAMPQDELKRLEHQLAIMQTDAAGAKDELNSLQEQLAVALKTNEQVKEQLMKESNEKKGLREQLESAIEEAKQGSTERREEHHQQLFALEQQLEREIRSRDNQEESCDALHKQVRSYELSQRKMEAELLQLESEKRHLEAEKEILSSRLDELKASQKQHHESNVQSTEVALRETKWEVDQLQSSLKAMEVDKEQLDVHAKQLDNDIKELVAQKHRLEMEYKNERNRSSKLEMEKSLLERHQQHLEEEIKGYQQKLRMQTTENGDLRGQLSKSKLKEQSAVDGAEHAAEELQNLVLKVQIQQRDLEVAAKELRAKTRQVEEHTVQCCELRADNDALQDQISELKSGLSCEMKKSKQETASTGSDTTGDKASPRELGLLRDQLTEYETKLDSIIQSKSKLVEKNRALVQKNMEVESSLRSLDFDKIQLERELEIASTELSKWKVNANNASKEIDQLTAALREQEAEKDFLDSTLRREADQKNELLRQKISAEQAKQALESDITRLSSQIQDMETSLRSNGFESQSLHNKIKRLESEVNELNSHVQTLQEHINSLERNASQYVQERSRLEGTLRVLKAESSGHLLKAQDAEEGLARSGDVIKRLEKQLADMQQGLHRERDAKEQLLSQVGGLTSAKEEAEGLAAVLKREMDAVEIKGKEQESTASRDEFTWRIKLQEAEAANKTISKAKEQVDGQLKIREREMSAAKDEIAGAKGEVESLQARIKVLLSEKEDIQTALLGSNLASAASTSSGCGSSSHIVSSPDAMLVKLQLADVNKNELESHLADVVSRLEISEQRRATLEARCRDQAIDIESLHMEMASLRSATQKMHLSALESLSVTERLEYEHKKRTLKIDFQSQLRCFQDREEQHFIRQKARLRAQYERHIGDLVAELEKTRQQRVEQEESVSLQVLELIRRESDVKVRQARCRALKELQELESDLRERKAHQFETLTVAIHKEEDDLNSRFREIRQATREEDLAKLQHSSEWKVSCEEQSPSSPGEMKPLDEVLQVNHHQASADIPTPTFARRSRPSQTGPQNHCVWSHRQNSAKHSSRTGHHQQQNAKMYRKWKRRLQEEVDLLAKAEGVVLNQRQGLMKQAQQLKSSKNDWKRASRTTRNETGSRIVQEMRHMLDENAANWSEAMKNLREKEVWIKRRQRKVSQLGRAVKQLKLTRIQRRAQESSGNNRYLYGVSDNNDSAEDDEAMGSSSGDSNQFEFESLLEQLEKLEEELILDVGESSESFSEQMNGVRCSRDHDNDHDGPLCESKENHSAPRFYASPSEAAAMVFRYPLSSSWEGFPARRGRMLPGRYRAVSRVDDFAGQEIASRRLHFQRISPLQRDRAANPSVTSKGARTDRIPKHGGLYQRKISRWAQGREKVQHAATNHATWLSGLCEELKEYGAKYSRGEGDVAAPSVASTL